jgi:hypothetical protein
MKMIAAMMLAGTFLLAQPAFAGTEAAPPAAEKATKGKKEKADKGAAGDKGAGGDKKEEPKKEESKKGGW